MENNQNKRPLRQAANTAKDIYNTYVKNDERKIPIESDEDKIENLEENMSRIFGEDFKSEDVNDPIAPKIENVIIEEQIESLENEIETLKNEIYYLKDSVIRKTAEMENMRRRMEKEKQDIILYANEKLLNSLVEIPDTITQALNAASKTNDYDSLLKGIELIYQKTVKLFENAGVKKIEINIGDEFNVDFHDALMQSPNEEIPEGHIVQVLQDGYMLGEKVLRHSKVITSAGN